MIAPGDVLELEVGKVANGGACIARHEGRVVFVRLALPGEIVRAVVTSVNAKYLRADTTEVVRAHPDRVVAPCRYASVCGGCDWQHASHLLQRHMKADIVREQLGHATGLSTSPGTLLGDLEVEAIGNSPLRYRTRNRYHRIDDENLGLYAARSKRIVEIDDCLIAAQSSVPAARAALPIMRGDVATVTVGEQSLVVDPRGGPMVDESVLDRRWRIHASSFWQVHRDAPAAFTRVVLDLAQLQAGERVADLYSGAGLFTAPMAMAVGDTGSVTAVESGVDAVRDARRSLSDLGHVELITADVAKWLTSQPSTFDVVVVDPPRTGVGQDACSALSSLATRAIVYVSCEPSSLARDAAVLLRHWRLTHIRAVDAFPMTSHVETFALFERP